MVRAVTSPQSGTQRFQFTLRFLLALTCLWALVLGGLSLIASEPERFPLETEEILLLAGCPIGALVGFVLGRIRGKRGILGGMLGGGVLMAAAATMLQPLFIRKLPRPPAPSWSFTQEYVIPIVLLTTLGAVGGTALGVILHLMLKFDAWPRQRNLPGLPVRASRGRRLCRCVAWAALLVAGLGAACWWLAPFGWRERATLTGHNGPALVAFAPDSRTLASATAISYSGVEDYTVRLWDVAAGKMRLSLDSPGYVDAIVFPPEGDRLITRCESFPHLSVWDIPTRREIAKLPLGSAGGVRWMRFSADGKALFVGTYRVGAGGLIVWDTGTWKVRSSFEVPGGYPSAISADGTTFAAIDSSGTVTLWEVPSGRRIKTFRGSGPPFAARPLPSEPTFSPDGNWLAAGSYLWNLRTGAVRKLPGGALDFTPDSRSLVVVKELAGRPWVNYPPTWLTRTAILGKMLVPREYNKLLILDVATGDVLVVSRPTHEVGWAALSPDGATIATGGSRGDIKLWDVP